VSWCSPGAFDRRRAAFPIYRDILAGAPRPAYILGRSTPSRRNGGADMPYGFLDIAVTPNVKEAQRANGSADYWDGFSGERTFDRFGEAERAFIAARDSFYMATVSESGWPYVQHRGGPPGFLKMLDEKTLGFADFRGNLQYISVGNVAADDRAALILVDYPNQARLKILAHVEMRDIAADSELAGRLAVPGYKAKLERACLLTLETFDWNCPQHITPRYTMDEIQGAVAPLQARIAQLEEENRLLRAHAAAYAR
jgi:predicted pyridoxine 5'-phosphate oxidase superfamily flavin-nucleotide-binding protein